MAQEFFAGRTTLTQPQETMQAQLNAVFAAKNRLIMTRIPLFLMGTIALGILIVIALLSL